MILSSKGKRASMNVCDLYFLGPDMFNGLHQRDASDSKERNQLVSNVKSWRLYPLKRPSTSTEEDIITGTDHSRKWIKGVVVCSWIIAAVLVSNIILTVAAVAVAYSRNDEKTFSFASLYMGKCSVAKNSTTGVHLVINILSTAMLGASNYCLQCLASPSRSEVDEAHGRKAWLQIGVPNIVSLLRNQRGRRWYLGAVLLATSLPIHLMCVARHCLDSFAYGGCNRDDLLMFFFCSLVTIPPFTSRWGRLNTRLSWRRTNLSAIRVIQLISNNASLRTSVLNLCNSTRQSRMGVSGLFPKKIASRPLPKIMYLGSEYSSWSRTLPCRTQNRWLGWGREIIEASR